MDGQRFRRTNRGLQGVHVNFLLDTHTLLWFLADNDRLSEAAKHTIETTDSVLLSCISLWKIAIKQNLGKHDTGRTPSQIAELCEKTNIEVLPINPTDFDRLQHLPIIHRDPFDRYLVACAQERSLKIVTRDYFIPQYDVETIW